MFLSLSTDHKAFLLIGWFLCFTLQVQGAPPFVSNVQALQRTDGSKLVDVYYDVADPDSDKLLITVRFSDDNGVTYDIVPRTLSGDIGIVEPGVGKHIIWDAGKDMPRTYGAQYRAAVTADDEVAVAGETITIDLPGLPAGAKPLEMVLIPAGTFTMGSPSDEQDRDSDEGPQHQVTITKDFYMGKYEVTQTQWQAVMGNNPSYFSGTNNPVERVSWNDCQSFIGKLNALGLGTFRLPTEAEWEYACRAGTTTRFYWGNDPSYSEIGNYAWYGGNSGSKTHEVGQRLPNDWGLYDMSGNVWEWCQDWYGSYPSGSQVDPTGQQSGSSRVLRGGVWNLNAWWCRSAFRYWYWPVYTYYYIGFRVLVSSRME